MTHPGAVAALPFLAAGLLLVAEPPFATLLAPALLAGLALAMAGAAGGGWPRALAGLATLAALVGAGALAGPPDGMPWPEVAPHALAAAGIAALLGALGPGLAIGGWRAAAAPLLLGGALMPAGLFMGWPAALALGTGVAATTLAARLPPAPSAPMGMLGGLAIAATLLAGPVLRDAASGQALLAALPGLLLVAAWRDLANAARLATALLALQAGLGLLVLGTGVAPLLAALPGGGTGPFRIALLGALFLPALAALLAPTLARGGWIQAAGAVLPIGVLPLLPVPHGLGPLLGPILATALAALLLTGRR